MLHTENNVLELTEIKLRRMKELNDAVKVLKAEYDMLKDELTSGWFAENEIYKTSRGLVLATYKPVKANKFDQSKFEEDHPDILALYKKESISYRFDLK